MKARWSSAPRTITSRTYSRIAQKRAPAAASASSTHTSIRRSEASSQRTPANSAMITSPIHCVLRCVRMRLRTSSPSTQRASAAVAIAGGVSSFIGQEHPSSLPTRLSVPSYTAGTRPRTDSAVALTRKPAHADPSRASIELSTQPYEERMDSQTGINVNDTAKSATKKSLRGFAAMDPQRQREIASLGGRAAHQSGHAHEFTSEEARAAGKKRHARASSGQLEGRAS
jgi:uncharacterized protein